MKKPGFWQALESLAGGAVMAEWALELGNEFERSRLFLRPSLREAKTYPCTSRLRCECDHRIERVRNSHYVAICDCGECMPIRLTAADLTVWEPNMTRLAEAVTRALGFETCASLQVGGGRGVPVGTYGAARSNVFFMFPADRSRMVREVERLFGSQPDPFLLLTPTGIHCSPEVESALRRQLCMHIPMSAALVLGDDGWLASSRSADSLLKEFLRRQAEGRSLVKTVERIDRNIEAVARDKYELRKENEELRQLNKDGYFNFAVRVNGDDFLVFAVIMALGNRKAAADHLKIPHRTLYNRVDQWSARGKEYQLMLRYIEWRKRSSRHLKVELNPSLQSGDAGDQPENPETMADVLETMKAADNRDYPAILAEVLHALERQNAGNWLAVRTELVDLIKAEALQ